MSNINELVYLVLENLIPHKFRLHMLKRTVPVQRKVFAGQTAARLAKERNPSLDKRKAYYRRLYLELKKREQDQYKARAKSISMTR